MSKRNREYEVNRERMAELIRRSLEGRLEPFRRKVVSHKEVKTIKATIKSLLQVAVENLLKDGFNYEITPQWDIRALQDPDNADIITVNIRPGNAEAERVLAHMLLARTGLEEKPRVNVKFEITEEAMEKNGNTFVPGARVQGGKPGTKTAGDRTGAVTGDVTDDGKMKVAWDDGTESFEDPGVLRPKS